MDLKIIIFLSSVVLAFSYITNDNGHSKVWMYPGWQGNKGTTHTQTIDFKATFQNVPQVIITPVIIDNYLPISTLPQGFLLEISSITTINFEVKLKLDYNYLGNYFFNWLAFDDQRFYVIHQFNQDNPSTITLPHSHKGAMNGIIFFTSFVFENIVDFTLDLGIITSTSVEVLITNTNLLKLSYTIVLGSEGTLESSQLFTALPNPEGVDCYSATLNQDKVWVFYPMYFSCTLAPMKLKFIRNSETLPTQYCLGQFIGATYLKFGHKNTFFTFSLLNLQPMLMQKVRVSKKELIQQVNQIQIEILEINVLYNTISENELTIPPSISTLSITASFYCQKQQKVTGKLLKSLANPDKYFESKNYCFGAQNYIQFYSKYSQVVANYQYLTIQITNNQLKVIQSLYNQQTTTKIILEVDITY